MEELIKILNNMANDFDPLDITQYQYLLNVIYTNNTVFNCQSETLNTAINNTLAKIKNKFFIPYDSMNFFFPYEN